jgi:arginine exporter protein ArgO
MESLIIMSLRIPWLNRHVTLSTVTLVGGNYVFTNRAGVTVATYGRKVSVQGSKLYIVTWVFANAIGNSVTAW